MCADLLKVTDLTIEYAPKNRPSKTAIEKLSFAVPSSGYTLGVVGESGSGKTTLGLGIMDLIEPPGRTVTGSVEFMGRNILSMSPAELRRYRWQEVSMVFQSAMNSLNPVKTVSNHIAEVITEHSDATKSEAKEKSIRLLSDVGINRQRVNDYAHEFSGGMRQRVVIAMALALSPKLLIADEPTSALDVVVQEQILGLIKEKVSEYGLSLLFITHEISILDGLVDNVAVMFAGEIVEMSTIDNVVFEPLHPYTEMLIDSLLTVGSNSGKLSKAMIPTEGLRSPIAAVGCKYSNRCKYAFDRCKNERPLLKEAEFGRWVACHKYNK